MSLEKSLQEQAELIREEAKKVRSAAEAHEDPIPKNKLAKKRLGIAFGIVLPLSFLAAMLSFHYVVLILLGISTVFLGSAYTRTCGYCGSFWSMRSIRHGTIHCKHCNYRDHIGGGYSGG